MSRQQVTQPRREDFRQCDPAVACAPTRAAGCRQGSARRPRHSSGQLLAEHDDTYHDDREQLAIGDDRIGRGTQARHAIRTGLPRQWQRRRDRARGKRARANPAPARRAVRGHLVRDYRPFYLHFGGGRSQFRRHPADAARAPSARHRARSQFNFLGPEASEGTSWLLLIASASEIWNESTRGRMARSFRVGEVDQAV